MAVARIKWTGGKNMERALRSIAAKMDMAQAVQVGFFEEAKYSSVYTTRTKFRLGGGKRKPLPVAMVAFWNIYGTNPKSGRRIPPRDFMGAAVRGAQGYWAQDIADLARHHDYDTLKVLTAMGISIKDDIVTQLERWSSPPNSKMTIAIKGFNKPLSDEKIMQRSVGFKVIRK